MKEKALVLNEFWLKAIAIISMTLDHVGYFLQEYAVNNIAMANTGLVFRVIGRIAFPVFIFMLAEGLHKTHDRLNYILRLAILWGVIFVAQFILNTVQPFGITSPLAQAFTDLLCYALFIYFIEMKGWLKIFSIIPLGFVVVSYAMQVSEVYASFNNMTSTWSTIIPEWARCAYSLMGFVIFLGLYYARPLALRTIEKMEKKAEIDMSPYKEGKKLQGLINTISATVILVVTLIFWAISYLSPQYDPYFLIVPQSYAILSIFVIIFYNGERGYNKKWFKYSTYLYYPVHIVLIALIFGLIFK